MSVLSDEVTLTGTHVEGRVAPERTGVLEPGAVVDRYVVVQKLGAGGMGVVYAAYDPELDRKVAIKLLLPGLGGDERRLRLIREAQALARLSHPNVVGIHDVGTVGGQVWLAMEFVQGRTLSEWLATPRRWPEVLEVLCRAGEGLAAAHAVGLLHRDFKPDNVMVGDDGRVRVMDFGLARMDGGPGSRGSEPSASSLEARATSSNTVTQVGVLIGTPSYMSPEHFAQRELSAASDQFAFCVTSWEALYGERPFEGDSPPELMTNVLQGKLRSPARAARAPGWLRRACERGLRIEPEMRWPSMTALLETLAKGRRRALVRKGLAVVGVLASVGVGVAAERRWDLAERTAACEASGAEIVDAWSPEREQELRDAFSSKGGSQASTTADKVVPWLEGQADAWKQARVEVCLDVDVRGRWSTDLHDRALWCLDQRRMELAALVDSLVHPNDGVMNGAVTAAAALAPVAPCLDEDLLAMLPLPAQEDREALRAVRAEIARASRLARAGRMEEGLDLAREAFGHAEALGWPPLVADARLQRGKILGRTGDRVEAEAELERAYFESVRGVAPETAFLTAVALVHVVGVDGGRPAEARHWGRLAEVALAELSDGEHLGQAGLLQQLAAIDRAVGDYGQAQARYEQVLAIREGSLGPENPMVAMTLGDLATIHQLTGNYEQAQVFLERAIAILAQAQGPEHFDVLNNRITLANVLQARGDYDEAKAIYEHVVASFEQMLGPEHPHVARVLNNLAALHLAVEDYEEAKRIYVRAVGIAERTMGLEHPDLAGSLNNLALVHEKLGARDEAKALHERALAIWERTLGPESPLVSYALLGLVTIALKQDRGADALPLAVRAVAVRERGGVGVDAITEAHFSLAQALWSAPNEAGRDRARARSLAEKARELYRAGGKKDATRLVEIEEWFAKIEAEQ